LVGLVDCNRAPCAGEGRYPGPPPQAAPARAVAEGDAVLRLPTLHLSGMAELSVDALVEQVLAKNPSLTQMTAAWQAASARYPQVTSLEDPMFAATAGPGTIAPDDPGIEFAYRLEDSQKLPFPGKRKLPGENAL